MSNFTNTAATHPAEPTLAAYSQRLNCTLGRLHDEPDHPYRGSYARDRDRILHSAAFRRLTHKTQVFVGQPDDLQRTRLTHTLEVSQIARTLARALRLNEDLTEAVALAHDLGHPPFGHAGERALALRMAGHGGFEHNIQSLRLLEKLETPYPAWHGLNLCFETLQCLAFRAHDRTHPDLQRFLTGPQSLLEGQVVNAADNAAYDAHDLDDALRAGLIAFSDFAVLDIGRIVLAEVRRRYPGDLPPNHLVRAAVRSLIDLHVDDVRRATETRLIGIASPAAAQSLAEPAVAPSGEFAVAIDGFEQFMFERVYRHPEVLRRTRAGQRRLGILFDRLTADVSLLPDEFRRMLEREPVKRVVCDYLAGMTDRFALKTYRRMASRVP